MTNVLTFKVRVPGMNEYLGRVAAVPIGGWLDGRQGVGLVPPRNLTERTIQRIIRRMGQRIVWIAATIDVGACTRTL